ncbi:hypothetical protein [Streptomyces sp. NBC_01304]|uniref:hypothetical protein n=1 Tax=Streptomyces sp. NBC_01304 TaxID=2903818 RepID=UPI002E0E4D74|nr:hypothetical protein OG430_05640 [Streptomyces sp. NBC_01304]
MLTVNMGAAAWAVAGVAVSSALVRLILAVLAAHAARRALRSGDGTRAGDRLRAHRLAVLRALVDGARGRR